MVDPQQFKVWFAQRRQYFLDRASYVSVVALPSDLEERLQNSFFAGKLSDFMSFNTDRHGKIRMYLSGVKTMFTDNLNESFNSFWVLDKDVVQVPDGTVTPTTGPGFTPNGGTPVAIAA